MIRVEYCDQARSQRPPSNGAEEIQGVESIWKRILTDNFIVTQKSCKRVCFLRRNAETQSSPMPRCVSTRTLSEPDLPAAPLSLTITVDGQ